MNKKTLILIILFLSIQIFSQAQELINSPYSFYGLGNLEIRGLRSNQPMGYTGIGQQHLQFINITNPASYTAFNPQTFIFDIGVSNITTKISTAEKSKFVNNNRFDNIAIGFKITKWWAVSAILKPFSSVGYKINSFDSIYNEFTNSKRYTSYNGNGGINEIILGQAFKPLKNFSLGVNISYLFGNINNSVNWLTYDIINELDTIIEHQTSYICKNEKNRLKGLKFEFGTQYCDTVFFNKSDSSKNISFTIGAVFTNKSSLKNNIISQVIGEYNIITTNTIYKEIKPVDTLLNGKVELPLSWGIGFSTSLNNRYTVAFDYYTQNWDKILINNTNLNLLKTSFYGLGFEYCHEKYSKTWANRIKYRLGGFYSSKYFKLKDNTPLSELGVTAGISFPLGTSFININFQYSQQGLIENNFVKEDIFIGSINFAFADIWFLKNKFR